MIKETFKHYFRYTKEEFDDLNRTAFIVFDTNMLLHFYRYSKNSREKLFEIVSKVSDRFYTTHQICSEFFKNRPSVIIDKANSYNRLMKDVRANFNDIITLFDGKKEAANYEILKFESELKDSLKEITEEAFSKIEKLLLSLTDISPELLNEDPILERLLSILADKIQSEFSEQDLELIYKDGKQRFQKGIPPGFEDAGKPEPERYNDLVIFKELIELSNILNKSIIFVTDDSKADWWLKISGRTIGPRPELLKEFREKASGTAFHMMSGKNFVDIFSSRYDVSDTKNLVNELVEFSADNTFQNLNSIKLNQIYFENLKRSIPDFATKYESSSITNLRRAVQKLKLQKEYFIEKLQYVFVLQNNAYCIELTERSINGEEDALAALSQLITNAIDELDIEILVSYKMLDSSWLLTTNGLNIVYEYLISMN